MHHTGEVTVESPTLEKTQTDTILQFRMHLHQCGRGNVWRVCDERQHTLLTRELDSEEYSGRRQLSSLGPGSR